jgi:hypothetical protein
MMAGAAQAVSYVATPAAQPVVSAAGIKHPALGFTLEQLDYARLQTRADVEPYKTYYNILSTVCCNYANINLLPTNRDATKVDTPNTPNYNGSTAQTRMINDSQGALTQAILYYVTGRNEYRRNAMRILRTWSNMNPAGYAYFPDAHIHNGVPLFRMLAAAEIMRYTPGDPTYAAYPLAWTDADTQKLRDNLIDPMERTFFASKERFMNQHVYSLVGRLAGAIFTDNRARYDETVEWMTVNASSTRQDINGAILPLIPLIDTDNPLNKAGYPFYQIQEMARDQAHGGDNVDNLTGLLRMVTAQGTRVDPYTGVPSTSGDAVSVYRFGGNRVLMGANAYAQYMLGYTTPWADTSGGTSYISGAYRGRLYEVGGIPELYNVYKYEQGVDVDAVAPYLATAAAHLGPGGARQQGHGRRSLPHPAPAAHRRAAAAQHGHAGNGAQGRLPGRRLEQRDRGRTHLRPRQGHAGRRHRGVPRRALRGPRQVRAGRHDGAHQRRHQAGRQRIRHRRAVVRDDGAGHRRPVALHRARLRLRRHCRPALWRQHHLLQVHRRRGRHGGRGFRQHGRAHAAHAAALRHAGLPGHGTDRAGCALPGILRRHRRTSRRQRELLGHPPARRRHAR